MAYDINYNDERFQKVESDKQAALNEVDKTYGEMIDKSDSFYQAQVDASKEWADKQTQLQQEKTDFAIDKIEQQKAQEKKDYLKEQSGAYVDWQKESNKYGANAEQQAAVGLTNTGYSESSQVSLYNTYQNRLASARESYNLAVQNYNNAITEARLQNNAALAQIAYDALQKQLELSLQGFQYKNQLVLEQANKKTELDQIYHSRWQDVLDQINTENALAEQVRQYNASLAEEQRQYNASLALQQAQLAEQKRQFNVTQAAKAGGGGTGGGGTGGGGGSGGGGAKIGKDDEPVAPKKVNGTGRSEVKASQYLEALIADGGSKDKVANEISLALREGAITQNEAARLRDKFTPRGMQY